MPQIAEIGSAELDIGTLVSGVYFVRENIDRGQLTNKIVKE